MLTVRYFAGAQAAAGVSTEEIVIPDGATVDDVLTVLSGRHGERFTRVLNSSSLLLNEVAVRDRAQRTPAGATLDVLPPFAGG